jgi:hypothetical protein
MSREIVHTRRLLIHLVSQHNLRPPRVVPPAPRVPLGPTRQVQLPVGIVTAAPLQDNQSVHLSYAVLISQLDGEAHVVALLILRHLLFFGHPWCSLLSSEHPTLTGPLCALLRPSRSGPGLLRVLCLRRQLIPKRQPYRYIPSLVDDRLKLHAIRFLNRPLPV